MHRVRGAPKSSVMISFTESLPRQAGTKMTLKEIPPARRRLALDWCHVSSMTIQRLAATHSGSGRSSSPRFHPDAAHRACRAAQSGRRPGHSPALNAVFADPLSHAHPGPRRRMRRSRLSDALPCTRRPTTHSVRSSVRDTWTASRRVSADGGLVIHALSGWHFPLSRSAVPAHTGIITVGSRRPASCASMAAQPPGATGLCADCDHHRPPEHGRGDRPPRRLPVRAAGDGH